MAILKYVVHIVEHSCHYSFAILCTKFSPSLLSKVIF